jgi:pimeloyl-ACP methyl ester carboxylesterase
MTNPTIVLVHGAFADGASWAPVTRELLNRGFTVRVPASYNRDLLGDAASIRSFVEQVKGPVLLVGHSYGGAVIGIAGEAENVVGLVYVAGYALDEGETLNQLQDRYPASPLPPNLVFSNYPLGEGTGTDVSVDISAFPDLFAIGVDPAVAEVLAVSQRPLSASVFDVASPAAAWKTKPSWGVVSSADRTINPDVERFGYERGGFRSTIELDSPHLVMHTHPGAIADFIETAAGAVATAD